MAIINELHYNVLCLPDIYMIGHCISADCKMGLGFARQLSAKYPEIRNELLKSENLSIGKSIKYYSSIDNKIIYNLITKHNFYDKPTYLTIELALMDMKEDIIKNKLLTKRLAMPKIGCGLDRKDWDKISKMIGGIFSDIELNILICFRGGLRHG